jgi:predicted transcriptional regulator
MGQIYILFVNNFIAMIESFGLHKDFIINHDINCIPANHQMMMGMLFQGKDRMQVNSLKPYHRFEYMDHHLSISGKIFAVSSVLIPELAKSMLQAARNGAKVNVILTGEILQSMKTDFPGILEEASRHEDVEIYRNNEVKILLIITESNLFLGLHRPDGSFDRDNIISCEDEGSMIWGNALFNHFLTESGKANAFAP